MSMGLVRLDSNRLVRRPIGFLPGAYIRTLPKSAVAPMPPFIPTLIGSPALAAALATEFISPLVFELMPDPGPVAVVGEKNWW